DFALAMLNATPGDPLNLAIEREGRSLEVAMRPEPVTGPGTVGVEELAWSLIGIQARPLSESALRRLNSRMRTKYRGGLYIGNVRPGSPADQQGISSGDILLGIHGWQTSNLADLAGILEHPDMRRGPKAKFYIVRREQTLFGHLQIANQIDPISRR
ncbi:MAG: PDZ domain-containing protein, partial [Novipirellula sp. JB048]